jgi:hypothetical protein
MSDDPAVLAALRAGEVMRVWPKTVCGSRSPKSGQGCRLEPGHRGNHMGTNPEPLWVFWENAEGDE